MTEGKFLGLLAGRFLTHTTRVMIPSHRVVERVRNNIREAPPAALGAQ